MSNEEINGEVDIESDAAQEIREAREIREAKYKLYAYWLMGSFLTFLIVVAGHLDSKTLTHLTDIYWLNIIVDYFVVITPLGGVLGFLFLAMCVWALNIVFTRETGAINENAQEFTVSIANTLAKVLKAESKHRLSK